MRFTGTITFYFVLGFTALTMTSCSLGILLFYRDSRTKNIYRSSSSKKNYYTIKATTLSHCGCTYLSIDNFVGRKRTSHFYYNYNNQAGKTIYSTDPMTGKKDTIRLIATTQTNFTVPFDSLDKEILNRIDTILKAQPKAVVYKIIKQDYKGFDKKVVY